MPRRVPFGVKMGLYYTFTQVPGHGRVSVEDRLDSWGQPNSTKGTIKQTLSRGKELVGTLDKAFVEHRICASVG